MRVGDEDEALPATPVSVRPTSVVPASVILASFVLVAALVAGTGSFALVLAAIWGLVAFCFGYTRRARKNAPSTTEPPRAGSGFRYNLCAFGLLYLIPMGIAATCYALLSLYVSWFGDSIGVDSLIAMQRTFEDTSRFFSEYVRLDEVEVFALLVAIYLLSCVLLRTADEVRPRRERSVATLHRGVEVYGKYSSAVAAGVATLASLTLFGMHLGEPAEDLHLRVKVLQQGYADVAARTEAELSERVAAALYPKVRDTFPPSYRAALRLPTRIDSSAEGLRHQLDSARLRYGVSVPAVERTLQEAAARARKVSELSPDLRIDGSTPRRIPGDITYDQVEAARDALDSRRRDRGVELVSEGKKKVTLHVEKLVGERIVLLTKPLTDAIPILEPLIQTFAEAADKTLQERIGKSYDRAMDAATRNPGDLDAVVEREARAIVAETEVGALVERATPRAQEQSDRLGQTLFELAASAPLIEHEVTEKLNQLRPEPSHLPELRPLPDLHLPPPSYRWPGYYPPGSGRYDPPGRITTPRPFVPPRLPPVRPAPPRFFW